MTPDNSSIDDVCKRMYEKEQAQLEAERKKQELEGRRGRLHAKKRADTTNPTTPITFTRTKNLFLPDYYVTNAGVYAKHVANIRDDTHHPTITIDGKAIHRPATFKEGIEVRVHIGENIIANNPGLTKEELKAKLNETKIFSTYQDSITAIAYQAKSTHFKIIPICTQLITIPHNNTEPFLALSLYNNTRKRTRQQQRHIQQTTHQTRIPRTRRMGRTPRTRHQPQTKICEHHLHDLQYSMRNLRTPKH